MKLTDIDEMLKLKENYLRAAAQLKVLEGAPGEGELKVRAASTSYTQGALEHIDWGVVRTPVIAAAKAATKEHHDKLVARLMLLGIDDWDAK